MLDFRENDALTMQKTLDVCFRSTLSQASILIASKRKRHLHSQQSKSEIKHFAHRHRNFAFDLVSIATCSDGPALQARKGQMLHKGAQDAIFSLTGSTYVWTKPTNNFHCGHWTTNPVRG